MRGRSERVGSNCGDGFATKSDVSLLPAHRCLLFLISLKFLHFIVFASTKSRTEKKDTSVIVLPLTFPLPRGGEMCIRIIERYGACHCDYYTHSVQPCGAYGARGHIVQERIVYVGQNCPRHSRSRHHQASSPPAISDSSSIVKQGLVCRHTLAGTHAIG